MVTIEVKDDWARRTPQTIVGWLVGERETFPYFGCHWSRATPSNWQTFHFAGLDGRVLLGSVCFGIEMFLWWHSHINLGDRAGMCHPLLSPGPFSYLPFHSQALMKWSPSSCLVKGDNNIVTSVYVEYLLSPVICLGQQFKYMQSAQSLLHNC